MSDIETMQKELDALKQAQQATTGSTSNESVGLGAPKQEMTSVTGSPIKGLLIPLWFKTEKGSISPMLLIDPDYAMSNTKFQSLLQWLAENNFPVSLNKKYALGNKNSGGLGG